MGSEMCIRDRLYGVHRMCAETAAVLRGSLCNSLCNNQTALSVNYFGGLKQKSVVKGYSHLFRITLRHERNESAREQRIALYKCDR